MAARAIRVASLFPDVMNVYADRGNLIALRARAEAHGVACEVTAVGVGSKSTPGVVHGTVPSRQSQVMPSATQPEP